MSQLDSRRWDNLLSWLRDKHGMDVSASGLLVERRDASAGGGKGLFAVAACPPSTTLFTIPATAMINVNTLRSTYPLRSTGRTLTAIQMISLHLLLHKPIEDQDSLDPLFGPYISTMPREFDSHPLTWLIKHIIHSLPDVFETNLLESLPPTVSNALSKLANRFWEDWAAISAYMNENSEVISKSSRTDLSLSSFRTGSHEVTLDYLWAWLNVNTRCIYYRLDASRSATCNLTMCPILDFANHAPANTHIAPVLPSDIWAPLSGSRTAQVKVGGDYIFISSSEASIRKDQELFLRYGGHANRTLFVEYGFVNTWPDGPLPIASFNAETDVQDLVEDLFEQRGEIGTRMKTVLEEEGYWGDWTLHATPQPAHPSYRLIVALRLYHIVDNGSIMATSELDRALQAWRNMLSGYAEMVSEENEKKWRATLLQICRRMTERAQRGLESVSLLKPGLDSWHEWMQNNVLSLWHEELEVANAVSDSIRANQEF